MATSPDSDTTGSLHRKTNWWGAFVIGLAGTLLVTGIGPYAVQRMGALAIPVFIALTFVGIVLCVCLAELAAMLPHRTGGLPSYATESYQCFGPGTARHIGGLSAWCYGLGWFPVAPINMILAARYIVSLCELPPGPEFTPVSAPINATVLVIAVFGLLLMFIPCYFGIRLGARFATALGVVALVPLVLLVFLPFLNTAALSWGNLASFASPGPEHGFEFYAAWIFIISWSVLGTEAAACYVGECRDPHRDAKIAMAAAGGFGFFIYAGLPLMLLVVLGANPGEDPMTALLAYTEAVFGTGTWVRWAVGVPLVVALLLSVLNALMGCGRSLYQASHDGLLPTYFGHTNRHGAPAAAMAFNLVCSILVVFIASPLEIYIFSNMGYLLSVGVALLGYFLYRQLHPDLPRPVRAPGFLRFVALGLGVALLLVWAYGGYHAADIAVGPGKRWLFFLGLGCILLYIPLHAYRRWEDRRAERALAAAPPTTEAEGAKGC